MELKYTQLLQGRERARAAFKILCELFPSPAKPVSIDQRLRLEQELRSLHINLETHNTHDSSGFLGTLRLIDRIPQGQIQLTISVREATAEAAWDMIAAQLYTFAS